MMKMAAVIFAGVLAMAVANAQETGAPTNTDPMGSAQSAPADTGAPTPTKAKKKHKKKKSGKKHKSKKKHHQDQ